MVTIYLVHQFGSEVNGDYATGSIEFASLISSEAVSYYAEQHGKGSFLNIDNHLCALTRQIVAVDLDVDVEKPLPKEIFIIYSLAKQTGGNFVSAMVEKGYVNRNLAMDHLKSHPAQEMSVIDGKTCEIVRNIIPIVIEVK